MSVDLETFPVYSPRCAGWREKCGDEAVYKVTISYHGARLYPAQYACCGPCLAMLVDWVLSVEEGFGPNAVMCLIDLIGADVPPGLGS